MKKMRICGKNFWHSTVGDIQDDHFFVKIAPLREKHCAMPVWNHPKKIDQHTHHGRKHAFHTQEAENCDFPPIPRSQSPK